MKLKSKSIIDNHSKEFKYSVSSLCSVTLKLQLRIGYYALELYKSVMDVIYWNLCPDKEAIEHYRLPTFYYRNQTERQTQTTLRGISNIKSSFHLAVAWRRSLLLEMKGFTHLVLALWGKSFCWSVAWLPTTRRKAQNKVWLLPSSKIGKPCISKKANF